MVYYIAKSFGKVIKRVFFLAKHIFFFEVQALLELQNVQKNHIIF